MSKVSTETVSPQKAIGDNLNYTFNYVYDDNYAHRLISAGGRYYKYDANGNIICEQDGAFDSQEEQAVYHKITQESENVYSTDYGWGLFKEDDKGSSGKANTTKYKRTYTWNERNQLISSVDDNYSTAYIYGQDGQRSNKYTQNSETLYFNKMWTLHTDSGNNVYGGQTAKNIYLGETRIVTKLNSGTAPSYQEEYYKQYYYHSDHLGSASMISDWEGNEYQRIEYTPYGETWVEKTQNTGLEYLPYRFTGKEIDEETGLYYYGARYLDPRYSRWISTDPALGEYIPQAPVNDEAKKSNQNLPGMGGVFNTVNLQLYHYAGNNPVKYTDPDGRIAFCAVTALIGAGVGAAYGAYKSYSATGAVDWKEVGKDALIGGAIGLGAGLIGAQGATSTALQAGNCLASFTEVTGIGATTVTTATTGTTAIVKSASSDKLAQNLINSGETRPMQSAAHHIVAGAAKLAQPARDILAKFNISINDTANGVFLPANSNSVNNLGATIHSTLHTTNYYETVNSMLTACTTKQEVLETLNTIKTMLQNGEF